MAVGVMREVPPEHVARDAAGVIAVVQARIGSSRLPRKVLASVYGKPMLQRVLERAKAAKGVNEVIVATSSSAEDDPIVELCARLGIAVERGSELDVLDRFYTALAERSQRVVVRLTGDCPLLDSTVIDRVVGVFLSKDCDYAANTIEPTYPDGLDVEVFRRSALETAWQQAELPSEREHVTSFIWTRPERFRLVNVKGSTDLSELRWTVDEPQDLELVNRLYRAVGRDIFGLKEALAALEEDPDLRSAMSKGDARNEGYRRSLERDRSITGGMRMGKGPTLYERAKRRIPGGTQLLSKRPEMFLPGFWPTYYTRAQGAEIWDLDGNRYLDMSYNGIGACTLGFADPDVGAAVKQAVNDGVMSTLNCPEEVELAERLCELHRWADMVRFTRGGGEAMAVAVRLARAVTGRQRVAFCGYHGWHDWYLAANLSEDDALDGHLLPGLEPRGVPWVLKGTAAPFAYNDVRSLEQLLDGAEEPFAAVVMEPVRNTSPADGFLSGVKAAAQRHGAVLVFDEITSGLRMTTGGAHLVYGVEPDLAVLAKALGNGHPIAAVIGRESVMRSAEETFISSTFWTDRVGPAAALATLRKHAEARVAEHLTAIGGRVQRGWRRAAAETGLSVTVLGIPALSLLKFEGQSPRHAQTVFTHRMLRRGYLASKGFYPTLAHNESMVDSYLEAVTEVFGELARLDDEGRLEEALEGEVAHEGFRRLT